jgi:hypothetical protein
MEFDSARFVLQLKTYYQQKASSTKKYRLIMILLFEPISSLKADSVLFPRYGSEIPMLAATRNYRDLRLTVN